MSNKAFIFDLDGVIVDTAKFHFLAWKNLANSIGIDFTVEQNEQLKGVSRVRSLEKILSWGNTTISETEFASLMTKKNDEYLSYIASMTEADILPGVSDVLDSLVKANAKIALGSASKNARVILKKVHLFETFNCIVDGTNVTRAKPDPEVFLQAADQLNASPENCIVFEDSVAGVQAANAANMLSIGIGEKDVLFEADHVFSDFTKMPNGFIKELI